MAQRPSVSTAPAPTTNLASDGRILALDILRGYFILIIASIHLAYIPSLLATFDGRGQLWFSEADGFFFISGLLIGIIRYKDLTRFGFKVAAGKTLSRAWKLYLTSIILTFIYVALARLLQSHNVIGIKPGFDQTSSWLHVIGQTLTFQYSYGWADFLMYYAAFLFIAPLALWFMSKKLWWVVLLASTGFWYWHWTGTNIIGAAQSFMLWQAPFFIGMIVGYHWDNINAFVRSFDPRLRRRLYTASIWTIAVLYTVSLLLILGAEHFMKFPQQVPDWASDMIGWLIGVDQDHTYNRLLTDGRGGLLRPVVLVIMMAGLYALVRRYEAAILRYAGWILVPFGRNSLYVYILQSVMLFTIPLFVSHGSFFLNTALELGITAVVWYAVHKRFLFKIIPR